MRMLLEFGRNRTETKADLTLNQYIDLLSQRMKVSSGVSVTPDNAMRCTTIQGIVRALTNAIGSYPPSVGTVVDKPTGPTVESQPNHAINRLLQAPNRVQTSTEFYRMVAQHLALWGNFYAIKGQAGTGPISFLRPIENPSAVTVKDVNWGTGVTYQVSFKEGQKEYPQRQILHVTCGILRDDGVTGVSPVEMCREAIGICIEAERLVAQLYGNNDVPTLALIGGAFRDEEHYKNWVTSFKEARGQISEGRGGTLVLPTGMEAREMSFKPIDAQLLEMRKFQRVEIAQVYGVPPHKLADLERATFSNIEEQSLEFVRDVAAPWVRLIAQALTRDLFTEEDKRAGMVVRFDMESATEGKLKDRIEAYAKGIDSAIYTPNQVRHKLGENPSDDPICDEYRRQLNTGTSNDELPGRTEDTQHDGEPPDGAAE